MDKLNGYPETAVPVVDIDIAIRGDMLHFLRELLNVIFPILDRIIYGQEPDLTILENHMAEDVAVLWGTGGFSRSHPSP